MKAALSVLAALFVTGGLACLAEPLAVQDQTFVAKAASGGMTEVRLGQLAKERGENPAVRSFGSLGFLRTP